VNGSHFAVFLFFGVFAALSLVLGSRSWILRLFLILFLLIMGYALVLTRARTAWIALGLGGCFLITALRYFRVISGRMFAGLIAAFVLVGILGAFWGGEILKIVYQRFSELWNAPGTPKFYNLMYRLKLWHGSLLAIIARPVGWGLGTFQHDFPQYRVHVDRFFVDYAHNAFLQLTVDLGLPGLAALLVVIKVYFRTAFLFLASPNAGREDKVTAIGFVATALSLILASLADFALRIYAISLFFAAFLALSSGLFETVNALRKDAPADLKKRRMPLAVPILRISIFLLVFIVNFVTARHLFAQIHFEKAVRFDKNFDWNLAEPEYLRAQSLAGHDIKYLTGLGVFYQKRSGLSFSGTNKIKYRSAAIQIYTRLGSLQPLNANHHYRLAFLFEEEKQIERAKEEFLTALHMEPRSALFLLEFGNFAIRHGMKTDALEAFEKYLKIPAMVEGAEVDPADLLKRIYRVTQNYDELKSVIHDNWYSHGCLGRILGENGRWELAAAELDLSLKQAGEIMQADSAYFHAAARKPVADFYMAHGHYQDALKVYGKAFEANPKDAVAKQHYDSIQHQIALSHSGT
jgi:tetratricopeptide (TPR) repeat protein